MLELILGIGIIVLGMMSIMLLIGTLFDWH